MEAPRPGVWRGACHWPRSWAGEPRRGRGASVPLAFTNRSQIGAFRSIATVTGADQTAVSARPEPGAFTGLRSPLEGVEVPPRGPVRAFAATFFELPLTLPPAFFELPLADAQSQSLGQQVRMRINAKAKRDTDDPDREKTLTLAELHAILRVIPDQHRLLFELLAGTGCRISEALGLDWTDLRADGDHTTLRIERQWYRGTLKRNAKTEAGERTVDLDADLVAKLWQRGADATGPMFATRTGKRLSDRNLRRVLDAVTHPQKRRDGTIVEALVGPGLEWVSFHTFRHTHGSMLIDQGWTIPEVSERLGHADPAITARVYSHKLRDRRREVPSFSRPIEALEPAS